MARSECTVCGEIFYSSAGFDRHRIGDFGEAIYKPDKNSKPTRVVIGYTPVNRRCMMPAEMLAAGMTKNQKGQWITESYSKHTYWRTKTGDIAAD